MLWLAAVLVVSIVLAVITRRHLDALSRGMDRRTAEERLNELIKHAAHCHWTEPIDPPAPKRGPR
jgi:hypothetical protein